ncbi:hypothetical protein [Nostoc sp.]|uniref:hypothetical protein n=1 Tax=Nostoc sp. TaxID=1180 RepID=UPI002FF699C5
MNKPIEFRIDQPLYQKLHQHLFPGDGDEHGAVIAAGIVETSRGIRLLAREVFLAPDGIDYVPGTRGYRALTAKFVAEISGYCAEHNLCYFAVHCHGGRNEVCFSADDIASHERGYPALLDITRGGPVGALVFAKNAVAGDIWTPSGRFQLDHMTVIGSHIRRLYPAPQPRLCAANPMYDRHARLFGDVGQEIFANLKVGIIGLGGGGSLINEWLSHLGVGHIIDEAIAHLLVDADFLFLAADSMQSRLVFNALVHQYLIPGIQIGAKVAVDKQTRQVGDIFTATRPVLPYAYGGCLHCHELIPAGRLQQEALSEEERRTQRYVEDEDIAQPSVITLNVKSAEQAVNDFMMMFTGLYQPEVQLCHQLRFARERSIINVERRANDDCLDCSSSSRSRRARGDRYRLPCRMPIA